MKKILMFLVMGIFLLSFVSSLDCWGTFKQNTDIDLIQKCPSCSYVNITSITYPNGTVFLNDKMTKTGINYYLSLPDSSQMGIISYVTIGDKNGADPPLYEELCIEITATGESKDDLQLYSRIFLIILIILLVIVIQRNSKKVNYDKWYDKMTNKWQERNWVKWGLSALGFNLMKNSWIFSYLAGLLGLVILTELTYFFNITSALEIMKIVLGLYSWSAIVVSLIFFSQVQEWIVGWLEDLQNLNWGIDKQ